MPVKLKEASSQRFGSAANCRAQRGGGNKRDPPRAGSVTPFEGAWGRGCPDSQKGHSTPGASLGRKGLVSFAGALAPRRELSAIFGHGLAVGGFISGVAGVKGRYRGQDISHPQKAKPSLDNLGLLASEAGFGKIKPAFSLPLDLNHSVYPGWSKPRSIRYKMDLHLQRSSMPELSDPALKKSGQLEDGEGSAGYFSITCQKKLAINPPPSHFPLC